MKSTKQNLSYILEEIETNSKNINENEILTFTDYIIKAKHIYLLGSGRSGLVLKTFTNRLMHLGFRTSFIGEVSTPHSQNGDILILNSGSGETTSLISIAKKAKEKNMPILLNTLNRESTLYKLADASIVLPGQKKDSTDKSSIQPMGSAFEQLSFLVFDAIVLNLMEKLNETNETMYNRHADLE